MSDQKWRIRYRRDIADGLRYAELRYPLRGGTSMEQIEHMLAAMPDPTRWEIVKDGE